MISTAVTGVVRDGHVLAVNKAIISNWHGYPLQRRLAEHFGTDKIYRFLNDAVAACWGEYLAREAATVIDDLSDHFDRCRRRHGDPWKTGSWGPASKPAISAMSRLHPTPPCGCGTPWLCRGPRLRTCDLGAGQHIAETPRRCESGFLTSSIAARTHADRRWVGQAIAKLLDQLDMIVDAGSGRDRRWCRTGAGLSRSRHKRPSGPARTLRSSQRSWARIPA